MPGYSQSEGIKLVQGLKKLRKMKINFIIFMHSI